MRLLLILVNEPVAGEVLPALAADVGEEKARDCYKALVEVMLKQLQGLEKCRIRFCYAPDDADDAVRFWLLAKMGASSSPTEHLYLTSSSHDGKAGDAAQEVDFRPQGKGNMAERIKRAFAEGFSEGYREIALIDPTCVECGARWINATFSRFHPESSRDTIIGPSTNERYYLLALKSDAPELFADIDWDSPGLLSSMQLAAKQAGRNLELLPPLGQTHNLEDWQRLLDSPLGPALKKALGEPLDEISL
jgi:glycosyltransferase A (GT-A) superfamily protein (DUF2064 family)